MLSWIIGCRILALVRSLTHAPEELTRNRLKRLGEGIGKVVYGSKHWVVKRERPPTEVVALIILWKLLRRWAHALPFGWGNHLMKRPSLILRLMRIVTQATMAVLPKSLWFTTHIAQVLRTYRYHDRRGERLARAHLTGTGLAPERITFPPATVLVGGWPGWLTVGEATERVEDTLENRLAILAKARDFDSIRFWLNRFLETRQAGWKKGLFSVDAHLKNFGIIEDRIVLLDSGGLTDRWNNVAARLEIEENVPEPHVQLGLSDILSEAPQLAREFNERWKAIVNRDSVQELWPED